MRIVSALLASVLCICVLLPFCMPADALNGKNSLTLHYYAVNEALPLADATFDLYRVAEPDGKGGYSLTADFKKYQVDISDLDWNEAGRLTMLAITLAAYVERDDITPLDKKTTNAKGDLTFADQADGLYLVWGDALTVDVDEQQWNFKPQPLLLPLPYPDIDGTGIRDMEVDVKYDRFPPPTMDDLVDVTVMKVWEGTEGHPDSVTAQLMRNGMITDSAELNESNNWQHTWKNLNSGYVWQIIEKDVPEGYYVNIHQEGYVFTIINTEFDTEWETTYPTEPSTNIPPTTEQPPQVTTEVPPAITEPTTKVTDMPPAYDDPTEPSADHPPDTDMPPETTGNPSSTTTGTPVTPSGNPPENPPRLPQTGQLWWPVPILTGLGLLLIGMGLLLRTEEK